VYIHINTHTLSMHIYMHEDVHRTYASMHDFILIDH
jgi:hypothetical protein